jgi:two-component system cell cycle response regulator
MFSDRMTRMVGEMGRQLVEGARRQALRDPLTGAHNRGYFNERLPREVERARAGRRPLAMALLDIDHFHNINATYGWPSGDAVLKGFVEVASLHVRLVDWLARYGGEEFAVVLPDTTLEQAEEVMERVRASIERAGFVALDGRPVSVTVSVGVAALEPRMQGPIDLVDAASGACLRAKEQGRNQVVPSPTRHDLRLSPSRAPKA